MLRRFLVYTFIAGLAMGVFTSCDNGPEESRSVVTVATFNGNVPVISDVLDQGDNLIDDATGTYDTSDDGVVETWIPLQFYNRPYSSIVTTDVGRPHNEFLITGYRVIWTRSDGGTPLPVLLNGTSVIVPSGEFVDATMVLVTFEDKQNAELVALRYAAGSVFMTAHITFYGHEVGTDREQTIQVDTLVEFADLLTDNGP